MQLMHMLDNVYDYDQVIINNVLHLAMEMTFIEVNFLKICHWRRYVIYLKWFGLSIRGNHNVLYHIPLTRSMWETPRIQVHMLSYVIQCMGPPACIGISGFRGFKRSHMNEGQLKNQFQWNILILNLIISKHDSLSTLDVLRFQSSASLGLM